MAEFKKQNEQKYTNKFTAEPTARPSYIPAAVGTYPVTYNMNYGGYGYMDTLGHWVMFDALTHMADRSYGGYVQSYPTTVVHTDSGGFLGSFLRVLGVIFAIAFILFIIAHFQSNRSY